MKKTTKSPLKAKPLRNPGQSADEKLREIVYEDILFFLIASLFIGFIAWYQWSVYITQKIPNPLFMTLFAVLFVGYALFRIIRGFKRAKAYKLGREGEKAVGQFLDGLREPGFKVFHDVVFDGFNIDHVIVCSKGVFAIETKTYSKPEKGETKIYFDGETLSINGFRVSAPLNQARASATTIKEVLQSTTGTTYPVWPVVLFPGWYIEATEGAQESIWVLNPKGLPKFLANRKDSLQTNELNMISHHLSRHIRAS